MATAAVCHPGSSSFVPFQWVSPESFTGSQVLLLPLMLLTHNYLACLPNSRNRRTKIWKKKRDACVGVYAVFIQVSPSGGVMNKSKLHLH